MTTVEIAARVYNFFSKTDARSHWGHGLLAFGLLSLPLTIALHFVLLLVLAPFGALPPRWVLWLLAGSFGTVAGGYAYTFRELEQKARRWLSGEIPSIVVGFRESSDARWDVFAAWIGAAIPGPLLAFGPDLLALIF